MCFLEHDPPGTEIRAWLVHLGVTGRAAAVLGEVNDRLWELFEFSVQSLCSMTQLALLRADEDIDPRAHTRKFAVSMLARLNELLPQLTEQHAMAAKRVRAWIFGLSTMAFIKLGCYDRAAGSHAQQRIAVGVILQERRLRQLASAAARSRNFYQEQLDYWNFVGAQLCFASKKHQKAHDFLIEIVPANDVHPTMDVEALVLSASIAIELVYTRTRTGNVVRSDHDKFISANKYLAAAETYLTQNTGSMYTGQINRLVLKLTKMKAELHLRQAQLMLRHGRQSATTELQWHTAIDTEMDKGLSEMKTVMEAIRAGAVVNGFFSSSATFLPKMHLLDACYAVLSAHMAKYTRRDVDREPLHAAERVLRESSNCAFAKLHLAYLCVLTGQQDGREILMQYLDLVFTEILTQRVEKKYFCAWCKTNVLPKNNKCPTCKVFRYCSRECRQAGNNRMHVGGNWLEPPHYRICPLLAQYNLLLKAMGGRIENFRPGMLDPAANPAGIQHSEDYFTAAARDVRCCTTSRRAALGSATRTTHL